MPKANKLLVEIAGKPMLAHVLERVAAQGFGKNLLVTQPDDTEIISLAERFHVEPLANPAAANGMSTSIATAISHLINEAAPDVSGAFIFLGDMPHVPAQISIDLYDATVRQNTDIAAPICDGRRGHPVFFKSILFPQLADLTGDKGASDLIARTRHALVPTDDRGVLRDYDTPADFDGQ